MNTASPGTRELARRLIALEAAGGPGGAARACERLRAPLAKLIGVAGYQSLISRALVLAKAEHPSLDAVRVRPDGLIEGFDATGPTRDTEAGAVVVAQLLWLLVTFIGEPLTLRLVRDAWPDAPAADAGHGRGEGP